MTVEAISNLNNDYANNIINPSIMRDGDIVEGLALVQDVKNGIVGAGKPVVRFYLRGQFNLVTQANLYLVNREKYSNEDALYFKNKIIYVKGIVNYFTSTRMLIELEDITEFKDALNVEDFFPVNIDIPKYESFFNKYLNIIEENFGSTNYIVANQVKIKNQLQNCLLKDEGSYVGDLFIITVKLMSDLLGANHKGIRKMYLSLIFFYELSISIANSYNMDATQINTAQKIMDITRNYQKYNLDNIDISEMNFLVSSYYCNDKPITHFSKTVTEGLNYYKNLLINTHIEYTPNIIHSDEHLRIER